MSQSIHDQITRIQQEAENRIQALKQQAASSIAKALYEAKENLKKAQAEVERLAQEYADATGKTIRGEKVVATTRRRLSAEDKAALKKSVLDLIRANGEGAKLGLLVSETGESASNVRKALIELLEQRVIRREGDKAKAKYLLSA